MERRRSKRLGTRSLSRRATTQASGAAESEESQDGSEGSGPEERRTLRVGYRSLQRTLTAEADKQALVDSNFNNLVGELENLHDRVCKPREQVSDAETLLQITSALLSSLSQEANGNVSHSQFLNALLVKFAGGSGMLLDWSALGEAADGIFADAPGLPTMLGPLDIQPKTRKVVERRRKEKAAEAARPEEVDDAEEASKAEVEKNMMEMFGILRAKKCVRLDALVLNRSSFAQTVENIFALSFLVRDGRAEIQIADVDGTPLVVPRNAPKPEERHTGGVVNSQFVFRFDYKDWEVMQQQVEIGQELMKDRVVDCQTSKGKQVDDLPARSDKAGAKMSSGTGGTDGASCSRKRGSLGDEHASFRRKARPDVEGKRSAAQCLVDDQQHRLGTEEEATLQASEEQADQEQSTRQTNREGQSTTGAEQEEPVSEATIVSDSEEKGNSGTPPSPEELLTSRRKRSNDVEEAEATTPSSRRNF